MQGYWTREDSTGAGLVNRRREFKWWKVSGHEARILLEQGWWTGGADFTGARLVESAFSDTHIIFIVKICFFFILIFFKTLNSYAHKNETLQKI